MKKSFLLLSIVLLIMFSGCTKETEDALNFDIISSNVTIWEDSTGEKSFILAFEVSNSSNKPLYFKKSDFDIVDENGVLIETMKLVNAYPPIIKDETAVYYDVKTSDKITGENIGLKAVPHIEFEKSENESKDFAIVKTANGGSFRGTGAVKNLSSRITHDNVHVATVTRKENDEVVSVMTAEIESIKPQEEIDFVVSDRLKGRDVGPNIVAKYDSFAYVDPK